MKNTFLIGSILTGLTISCSPKVNPTHLEGEKIGETVEVKDKNIDWEAYDISSITAKTEIKTQNLQGLWNAYKGVYRFGEYLNAMELTKPAIVEIKDDTYRRNLNSEFEKFTLKNNFIIAANNHVSDTGVINKITATELTISWKDKSNYTRYYYKK